MKLEKFKIVLMPEAVTTDEVDHEEKLRAVLRSAGYVIKEIEKMPLTADLVGPAKNVIEHKLTRRDR